MGNDQSSAPKDGDGVSTSQQVRESSKKSSPLFLV